MQHTSNESTGKASPFEVAPPQAINSPYADSLDFDQLQAHGPPTTAPQHSRIFDSDSELPDGTAEAICQMFSTQYGPSYPSTYFSAPCTLKSEIQRGNIVSFVMSHPESPELPIAHAGVTNLGDNALEIGQILVAASSRRGGFGALVTADAINYARSQGADLVLAWTYTTHTGSQKIFAAQDFTPIGITVQDWPDVFNTGSRDGALVVADTQHVRFRQPREVYCCQQIAPILEYIYANLGCDRTINLLPDAAYYSGTLLSILPSIDKTQTELTGSVAVFIPPQASEIEALKSIDALIGEDHEHVSVRLNLCEPQAIATIQALIERGFYFSMVQPFAHGDMLTLQRNKAGLAAAKDGIELHGNAANEFFRLIEVSCGISS